MLKIIFFVKYRITAQVKCFYEKELKVFQPMLPGETPDLQDNEQLPDSLKLSVLDAKSNKNKDYRIGKLIEPHRLENFTDKDDHGILDKSFDKDLVWGIAGGLPQPDTGNEEYPQIGSWTAFQKQVIVHELELLYDQEYKDHLSRRRPSSTTTESSVAKVSGQRRRTGLTLRRGRAVRWRECSPQFFLVSGKRSDSSGQLGNRGGQGVIVIGASSMRNGLDNMHVLR
eukprot:gene16495-18134_t